MEELFKKLSIPQINDVGYAVGMQELVQNINDNFAKVASLPFLKGDKGNSIEVVEEPIFKNTTTQELTDFGIALIFAIYNVEVSRLNDLISHTDEIPIKGEYSWTSLSKVSTISVFFDKVNGEKHLAVPFTFMDARKNYLQNYEDTKFHDMSTFVLGKGVKDGEKYKWLLSKEDYIPNLYYDEEEKRFCWAIGSTKTGIIAQGIEGKTGEDGHAINCWYCRGKVATDIMNGMEYVKITELFDNDKALSTNPFIQLYNDSGFTTEYNALTRKLEEYDFVILESIKDDLVDDILFGSVVMIGEKPYIQRNSNASIHQFVRNLSLYDMLVAINFPSGKESMLKGIFTMPYTGKIVEGQDNRVPHAFWSPDSNTANLGRVELREIYNSIPNEPNASPINKDSRLNILYNETTMRNANVHENLEVEGNAKVNNDMSAGTYKNLDNTIFEFGVYDGETQNQDKFVLEGETIGTNHSSASLVFFPSTDITYIEPATTSFPVKQLTEKGDLEIGGSKSPAVKLDDTGKSLSVVNSIPSNKNTTKFGTQLVNLGGTYEFGLPYLGKLPDGSSDIYDTAQFISESGATKLTVKLSPLELSIDDKNNNDNTWYGWRHFYDVSLLASPISQVPGDTFKQNEAGVYVGTSEIDDLTLEYDGKVHKYKVKVSCLQYRVKYKKEGLDYELQFRSRKQGNIQSEFILEKSDSAEDFCNVEGEEIPRTVTEVVYYIFPMDKNSSLPSYICNRYRLFFSNTPKSSGAALSLGQSEYAETIYIEPISEPGLTSSDRPLIKYVSDWKTKYPEGRAFLNNMVCTPKPKESEETTTEYNLDFHLVVAVDQEKIEEVIDKIIKEDNQNNQNYFFKFRISRYIGESNILTNKIWSAVESVSDGDFIKVFDTTERNVSSNVSPGNLGEWTLTNGSGAKYTYEFTAHLSTNDEVNNYKNDQPVFSQTLSLDDLIESSLTTKRYFHNMISDSQNEAILYPEVLGSELNKFPMDGRNYRFLIGGETTNPAQFIGQIGMYNNFVWVKESSDTITGDLPIAYNGLGAGIILPSNAGAAGYGSSWYVNLGKIAGELSTTYDRFSFSNSGENELSNNLPEPQVVSIGEQTYNIYTKPDDGWYIDSKKIETKELTKLKTLRKTTTGEPEEPITNLDKPVLNSVEFIPQGTAPKGVRLSWIQIENANGYNIQANLSSGSTKEITGFSIQSNGTSITADLDSEVLRKNNLEIADLFTATFQVQAVNSNYSVTSEWSDPVGLTTN